MWGIGSFVATPFPTEGEWRPYLGITDSRPRVFRDDELELLRDLALRIFPRLERARAEAALRASEARYRTLVESLPLTVTTASVSRA